MASQPTFVGKENFRSRGAAGSMPALPMKRDARLKITVRQCVWRAVDRLTVVATELQLSRAIPLPSVLGMLIYPSPVF